MKMSTQNPLTGMQSIQQAPGGLPPALAQYFQQQQELQAQQQQQASPVDQSQLAEYIKQLQDNGASPSQLQGAVQQIQQNGGQIPQQPDTMQGGSGADNMANNAPHTNQMSPFSQQLNAIASGNGNVNYDQISGAYPTPRAPIVQDRNELISQGMANSSVDGRSAGMQFALAQAAADKTLSQQKADYQKQLDARDLGAYGSQIGLAEKAASIQAQMAQLAREKARDENTAAYQKGELGIRQQNADADKLKPLGTDKDGNAVLYNMKDGTIQTIPNVNLGKPTASKPLSADLQKQLSLGLDQFIGVRDAKGNTLDVKKDIDPTQKNNILAASAMYLQQNPNVGVQGALGHIINEKLGGIGNIQDATSPWIGKKTPRMFTPDKISGLNATGVPQTAPNVSGAPAETIPTGGNIGGGMAMPKTKADLDALPSGTRYVNPVNNAVYTKP